jgi:hypothetical protein
MALTRRENLRRCVRQAFGGPHSRRANAMRGSGGAGQSDWEIGQFWGSATHRAQAYRGCQAALPCLDADPAVVRSLFDARLSFDDDDEV